MSAAPLQHPVSEIPMRTFLLPLLAAALAPLASAAEPAAPAAPATAAPTPAPEAEAPYKAGDAAPAGLLPAVWVRGEPVKAFEPGVTYVIATWNTVGGHAFAPGYNLRRALEPLKGEKSLRTFIVFLNDDIAADKLAKRLARPSQQTPFPLGHATPGSVCEKAFARLRGGDRMRQANTLVVRDGRVLWVGEGGDLSADTLTPFLKPGFDYDTHVKEKAAYDARTGELLALLVKGLPAASKANDEAKVAEILETLEKEPNLHPFLFQRLRDTKCGIAFGKGDIAGAVAEMQKLADKEPDNAATQSWVHKVIMSTEAMNKPGMKLAAEAAARVAQLKEGDMARAWWEASAEHRLALGDKAAALAALEEAEKQSDPYRRLQAMKSAK